MNEIRPGGEGALEEQLARHEATGELPLGAHVNEVLSKVDRYLQAIARAHQAGRLRPGAREPKSTETRAGASELGTGMGTVFGGISTARRETGKRRTHRRRWPAA